MVNPPIRNPEQPIQPPQLHITVNLYNIQGEMDNAVNSLKCDMRFLSDSSVGVEEKSKILSLYLYHELSRTILLQESKESYKKDIKGTRKNIPKNRLLNILPLVNFKHLGYFINRLKTEQQLLDSDIDSQRDPRQGPFGHIPFQQRPFGRGPFGQIPFGRGPFGQGPFVQVLRHQQGPFVQVLPQQEPPQQGLSRRGPLRQRIS